MRLFREVFDDWLTRAAGFVCLAIIVIVIFNMKSDVAEQYPLLECLYLHGTILFIAGGLIFIRAILKFSKQGNDDTAS